MSLSSLGIAGAAPATAASAVDSVGLRQALSSDAAALASIAASADSTALVATGLSVPAAALAAAVQTAAGRQGGLSSLFADLESALQSSALPPAVADAAEQLLGLALPIVPPPSAADLRQALAQSGLFFEAQLAAGASTPGGDVKSALLDLELALQAWTGETAPRLVADATVPPPYRGGPLQGQPPAQANLPPDATNAWVGAQLMQSTSRALARTVLLQAASLPRGAKASPEERGPRWRFDIPLDTPAGGAVAQFEISRDDSGPGGGAGREPVWQAHFSIHLEPMGPVQAKVALNGDRVRVTLWADRRDTADALAAQAGDLTKALADEKLTATVNVIPAAPVVAAPSPGVLVDQAL